MKKVLLFLLASLLVISSVSVFAEAPALEFTTTMDYIADGGKFHVNWDSIYIDASRETLLSGTTDGGARDFMAVNEGLLYVEDPLDALYFWGWIAADQEIKGFGYSIDGAEPVYEESNSVLAEAGVVAAAASVSCDYSSRFYIHVDLSTITSGKHEIKILVKLADEIDYILCYDDESEMTLYYDVYDPNATPVPTAVPTPEPTAEPTAAPTTAPTTAPTEVPVPADGGCGSVVCGGAAVLLLAAAVILRKKED